MDGMAMEAEGKNQQPGQVLLLEANYTLDHGRNCAAQAIQLLDQTLRNLAIPKEALEKIHIMVTAAIQEDGGDHCTRGDIRLHISVTNSHVQSPSQDQDFETALNDRHHPWGMFLVQHSETDEASRTCQRIELRLYREVG